MSRINFKNITGLRFNKLLVLERTINDNNGSAKWLCRCDCGNHITVRGNSLRDAHTTSCGCEKRYVIPIGETFNHLTIISLEGLDQYNYQKCKCLCSCGKEKIIRLTHVLSGKVKSCGCLRHRSGKSSHSFRGYGEISGWYWCSIKSHADRKTRKLDFNITIEYIWNLFLQQNRKCALSDVELQFGSRDTQEITASLDRIDSSKGYIIGNVQWVHKDVNRMKSNILQDKFINYCKLIVNKLS